MTGKNVDTAPYPLSERRKIGDSPDEEELVWLIEVKLGPLSSLNLYTYILSGVQDFFLEDNEGLIFAMSLYKLAEYSHLIPKEFLGTKSKVPVNVDEDHTFDIQRTLQSIENLVEIDDVEIVNEINFLLDVVRESQTPMPIIYRDLLFEFANHMTFSRNVREFFERKNVDSEEVWNALHWCLGVFLRKVKIVG